MLMKNILFIISLILLSHPIFAQDEELDLDAMWDNTVWNEIEDVSKIFPGQVLKLFL